MSVQGDYMTSIEEDIVAWAGKRPDWQRNILSGLARGESLDGGAVSGLVDQLLAGTPVTVTAPLMLADMPSTTSGGQTVTIASIGNLSNVNALLKDQMLSFGASGLTVVYGDNGSGKSGYARLLKELVGARHKEPILPNAFSGATPGAQSARVTYAVDAEDLEVDWPDSRPADLGQVHFYDEACGNDYLGAETELAYRPSVLRLFDHLVVAVDQIRAEIDTRVDAVNGQKVSLPKIEDGTVSLVFLTGLSGTTSRASVDGAVSLPVGAPEKFAELVQEEARLKATDPTKEKTRLTNLANNLDWLVKHLAALEATFSSAAAAKVEGLASSARDLRVAADLAAKGDFVSEPLDGVGSETWRALWSAAQAYSEAEAFVDRKFPGNPGIDHCVLCQQPLTDDGHDRLIRFHAFVHNDTETKAKKAETEAATGLQGLSKLEVRSNESATAVAAVKVEDPTLGMKLDAALETAEKVKLRISACLREETEEAFLELDAIDVAVLEKLSADLRDRASKIDAVEFAKQLAAATKDKNDLAARRTLAGARSSIDAEIVRLKDLAKHQVLRSKVSTSSITSKSTELSRTYVTQAVSDRFTRESDRLMLERVVLGDRGGTKGRIKHRPALLGTSGHAPSQVLSEGEQTALGLAGLFTEIFFDESKSAVVMDDPVSSLDHTRRKRVAQRIAGIAETRQVVVFTHDLTFLGELVDAASVADIVLTERTIERSGDKTPGFVVEQFPWKAKDAKKRLGDLRAELDRIKKAQASTTGDEYERQTCDWAGRLSETWERIVRSEVAYKLVDRSTTEVRPKMFRIAAKITEADDADFQAGYGEASEWARRHDKSEEFNYVAPTVDDMEVELRRIVEWHARVGKYSN